MQWWKSWRRQHEPQQDPAAATDVLLSAYLDGDLGAPERTTLEQRLTEDASLREAFESLRDVVFELHRLDDLRAPRAFTIPAAEATRPRVLAPLELGLRVGAVAAAAAFVLVLGMDIQRGGAGGVRGQTAPLRLQAESAASSSFTAPDAPVTDGAAASGAFRDAAPGRGAAESAADDAVSDPDIVPTSFVTQPVTPSTAPSPATPAPDADETTAATPVPSRTPALAVTSASTTTSALQATPAARVPTPAAAVASSTPALALVPAIAPTTTPAAVLTPAATRTPPAAGAPAVTSTATTTAPPQTATAAGQGGADSAPPVPSATPAVDGDEQQAQPPVEEQPSPGSAPLPVAPAIDGAGASSGGAFAPDQGLIKPVPAEEAGAWGQSATRVSVTHTDRFDGFRAAEFGLGALALGLGSMTGWVWFARRRAAAASGF